MVLVEAGVLTVVLLAIRVARCCYAHPRLGSSPEVQEAATEDFSRSNAIDKLKKRAKGLHGGKDTFPLLKKKHIILTGYELKARVVIIGDIHGCFEELVELLNRCSVDENTNVILVGDLVNKGPYSAEVVAFARRNKFLSVRGNHDEAALKDLHARGNKYDYVKNLSAEDIEYLEQMPYTITIPEMNAIIVHAGLVPDKPLEEQSPEDMTLMRNIAMIRADDTGIVSYVTSEHGKGGSPWATAWRGPQHVYFGHDAKRGLQMEEFATGLDTGACYGRRLSAFILPEKRLVQVDAAHVYQETAENGKKKGGGA